MKIVKNEETTDRLLTVREVASRLGISSRQVWKLQSAGQIPRCVRLGGSVRWRSTDIDQFISNGCKMSEVEGAAR